QAGVVDDGGTLGVQLGDVRPARHVGGPGRVHREPGVVPVVEVSGVDQGVGPCEVGVQLGHESGSGDLEGRLRGVGAGREVGGEGAGGEAGGERAAAQVDVAGVVRDGGGRREPADERRLVAAAAEVAGVEQGAAGGEFRQEGIASAAVEAALECVEGGEIGGG